MKADEKPTRMYRTLKGLEEEFHPKGEKVAAESLEGVPLLIKEYNTWYEDGRPVPFVTAIRQDTGEMVSFNGGIAVLKTLEEYKDHLPFVATMRKTVTKKGRDLWVLE